MRSSTTKSFCILTVLFFLLRVATSQSPTTNFPASAAEYMEVRSAQNYFKDVTRVADNFSQVNFNDSYSCGGSGGVPAGGAKEIVAVVLVLVVFGTVVGNMMVIATVITFHELQTITNMFVASLACADLIMGAFVMPVGIPYVLNGAWNFGSIFCKVWISIDVLSVTASIETLCAIALDRYLAITRPFTYTSSVTRTKARWFIAFIWITSASIAFIPVQLGWWRDDSQYAQCCYDAEECCEFLTNQTFAAVSSCASFYIPLLIMIFSYAIVFKEAIRLAAQIDGQTGYIRRASMPGTNRPLWNREQRRTVFTFGYIMGIFTACWLPFFVTNLVQAFCRCVPRSVFTTSNWLGYANSFFNPIIYCHNAQFRQAFSRLLTCLPCTEGFERTKRASLSETFPRYRVSTRESTLDTLTTFFLSGGSSRKKSRRSATSSMMFKRDSCISSRSPTRSTTRHPRFVLGPDDHDINILETNNDLRVSFNTKTDSEDFHNSENSAPSVSFEENGLCYYSKSSYSENEAHICKEPNGMTVTIEDSNSNGRHLSLLVLPSEFSVAEERDLISRHENGNGRFSRQHKEKRQQIRTRRSKSLFVSAHEKVENLFPRLPPVPRKASNSSCSNISRVVVFMEGATAEGQP